jgi:hypothetical protein
MRLKELRVSGFRSIGTHAVIEDASHREKGGKPAYRIVWAKNCFDVRLPVSNDQADHMMAAIMGPNSVGKSTILLAMNLFFSNVTRLDAAFFHQPSGPTVKPAPGQTPVIMEAVFAGNVDAEEMWITRHCRAAGESHEMTLVSVWNTEGRQRYIQANDGLYYKLTPAQRAICERQLPIFRTIWADIRPGDAAELKRDSLLADLVERVFQQRNPQNGAGRLHDLLAALEQLLAQRHAPTPSTRAEDPGAVDWSALEALEAQLSEGLAQLTPQRSRVQIRLDAGLPGLADVLARGVTVIDDGATLPFDQHGLGVQRAFAVSVLKAWCNQMADESRDYIFAIEEPEIYLHPHATRVLLRLLEEIAVHHQVVFTTHAGEFVNRAPLRHVLMVSRRAGRKGSVSQVRRPQLRSLKAAEMAKVQRYLREDRSDMLFARAVLLVEGQAELFALPSFAARLGLDLDAAGVSVVFVNGIGNFGVYHQILRGFGIPHVILMDGDGKGQERMRAYEGMAQGLVVLAHDFERELVNALTPERRSFLARECLRRRGKPGASTRKIGSGARGAHDLASLGKPLVGRVAGEVCTVEEIRRMKDIVCALEQTVKLAGGLVSAGPFGDRASASPDCRNGLPVRQGYAVR